MENHLILVIIKITYHVTLGLVLGQVKGAVRWKPQHWICFTWRMFNGNNFAGRWRKYALYCHSSF